MEGHLAEFLFAELLLLLVSAVLALVGYLLKRHINTTDRLSSKVEGLADKVTRLLERDRQQRLADYGKPLDNGNGH